MSNDMIFFLHGAAVLILTVGFASLLNLIKRKIKKLASRKSGL